MRAQRVAPTRARSGADRQPIEMRQAWSCDKCGTSGTVRHAPNESQLDVMATIAEQHAIANLECYIENGTGRIRFSGRAVAA